MLLPRAGSKLPATKRKTKNHPKTGSIFSQSLMSLDNLLYYSLFLIPKILF